MYKLIIFFHPPSDIAAFEASWQHFLHLAEQMPGLQKEIVSRMKRKVAGNPACEYHMTHELLFKSRHELEQALSSETGQAAGKYLQEFTRNRVEIIIAEHLEAHAEQFRKQEKASPLPEGQSSLGGAAGP